ncbi:MAG: glycosyltransferase family 2 protein [Clostridia bacterium]|nr:glycosyltransferase family 2 protein [Clostridia bacterium]
MHDSTISVVIPVYNGRSTLGDLVNRLNSVLADYAGYEIILVDDASPDGSFIKIKELAGNTDNIIGILLDSNYGQQSATLCGLRHATMDCAIIMDDDLEHRPEDIPLLVKEMQSGYDVVYALNEEKSKTSMHRKLGSRLRDVVFNVLTDKPRDLKVCSFRILNRKTIENVVKADGKFVYISMEIMKHTVNIGNIKVQYGERTKSGHKLSSLMRLLLNIVINYSKNGLFRKFRIKGSSYAIETIVGKAKI